MNGAGNRDGPSDQIAVRRRVFVNAGVVISVSKRSSLKSELLFIIATMSAKLHHRCDSVAQQYRALEMALVRFRASAASVAASAELLVASLAGERAPSATQLLFLATAAIAMCRDRAFHRPLLRLRDTRMLFEVLTGLHVQLDALDTKRGMVEAVMGTCFADAPS